MDVFVVCCVADHFTFLMKQGPAVRVSYDIIDRTSENVDSIRYNQTMVKSLHENMVKMKELLESLDDEADGKCGQGAPNCIAIWDAAHPTPC